MRSDLFDRHTLEAKSLGVPGFARGPRELWTKKRGVAEQIAQADDRIRQQRHRNFQASQASGVTERDTSVTECDSHAASRGSRMSRQEEEEEEEEKTKNKAPKRQKPKPGILNSIEAAKGYCNTFSITGGRLGSNYDAIREAIEVEMANSSDDPQAIAQRMIEARERY